MKYIIGFLTIAILSVGCKGDLGSPKGTVTAFLEAMKKGDIESVKKLISKSDLSMITTAETLAKSFGKDVDIAAKMKAEFAEKSKDVSYTIKDEKIDGDKATVNVEIRQNNDTSTHPFQLVKEDGSWKISLISTGLNGGSGSHDINGMDPNINISDSIAKGMDKLRSMNSDSLASKIKEGMDKLKENPEAIKKMQEAMDKLKEATEKMKQQH